MNRSNKNAVWIRIILLAFFAIPWILTDVSYSNISGWFFISVIGIALITIVNYRKKNPKVIERKGVQSSNTCKQCGAYINPNDTFCGHCGTALETEVICDYCGTKNSSEDLMCKNCNGLLK